MSGAGCRSPAPLVDPRAVKNSVRDALAFRDVVIAHGCTFIRDVPLTPEILAVIVAVPTARPFITALLPGTTPRLSLPVTIATVVSLLAHIISRATSVSPLASVGVATSFTVFPTATLSGAGLTLTAATDTATTLIDDVPF